MFGPTGYVSFGSEGLANPEVTEIKERAQELQQKDKSRKIAALMSAAFFAVLAIHLIISANMDCLTLVFGLAGAGALGSSLAIWKVRSNLKKDWEIIEEDPSMKWKFQDMIHDLQELKNKAEQKINMWKGNTSDTN